MTHDEAYINLRAVAAAFKDGTIDRYEWFEQVYAILMAVEGNASGLPPELHDAALGRAPATRTSTKPGRPPRESSSRRAARPARAAGQA